MLLSHIIKIYAFFSAGKPVDLPKSLCDRYKKCLDILNISEIHRKLIKPFTVFGFDLFHAGESDLVI